MTSTCRNVLILHSHLPWLRHADSTHCPEEDWWLEVVTESILPLLEMLHRLRKEAVPFKLTLVVTPTVLSMMKDPLLQERAEAHLDRSLHLAHTEIERGTDSAKRPLAQWYADHYHRLHRYYCDEWKRDLVPAINDLRQSGHLEIAASAATHALLPLFLKSPDILRTQIDIGCSYYKDCFGESPKIFWLPDCAYSPALEPFLTEAGIQHVILDEHALTYSEEAPDGGVYYPTQTPDGCHISCRDVASSREILNLEAGLVHDTRYREASKMSNEDTPVNALKLHIDANQGTPVATLKIHGMDSDQLYNPAEGKKAAQEHAKQLLKSREKQFSKLIAEGIANPSVITVYETELFGHWRFEGIPYLEETLRLFAEREDMELASLYDASEIETATFISEVNPVPSSWGEGDYFENWLSQENAWIYPHLLRRAGQLQRIIDALNENLEDLPDELAEHRTRCICQMTRELLLAQSSDWADFMRYPATQAYATHRFENHLENFDQLATLYSSTDDSNTTRLRAIEQQNPIFPNLEWNVFASSQ